MSREIKFRAWNKDENKMYKDVGVSQNGDFIILEHDSDGDISTWYNYTSHRNWEIGEVENIYEVMQYTGLSDKNGVEIYEGDVLRYPAKDKWEETSFIGYEVFYHDNDCADNHVGFQMNRMHFYGNLCGGESNARFLPKYTSKMIVIGNIFEDGESV